jgi:hypothetical protein
MKYDYLVCYLDKSGEQATIPFTSLTRARKCALRVGGLVINLKG